MGCPAHTLLDPHPDFFPFDDFDALHFYAKDHVVDSEDNLVLGGDSLRDIMTTLAKVSAQWDSDDRCGHGPLRQGGGSLNGLSAFGCPLFMDGLIINADLQRIVSGCMPVTEMAVTRVFMLFFDEIRPPRPQVTSPRQGIIDLIGNSKT